MYALVVDDDHAIATMAATVLSLEGIDTTEAHDGPTALESMRDRKPDVVILDVMMPGMDGLAVLSEMRTDPELRRIPVVIMSARGSDRDQWEGWRHGADSYVVKPFETDVLVREVLRVTSLDRSPET
jgi:DNA-binding response OmpR family regulator